MALLNIQKRTWPLSTCSPKRTGLQYTGLKYTGPQHGLEGYRLERYRLQNTGFIIQAKYTGFNAQARRCRISLYAL